MLTSLSRRLSGLCGRVEKACKKACEYVLKFSDWQVRGEKVVKGESWEQKDAAKRQLHMHHCMRALATAGCGGKEDERVSVIYEKLKVKFATPKGSEGWCKWASDVGEGGRERVSVGTWEGWEEGGELRDDLISLFVVYAECVLAR